MLIETTRFGRVEVDGEKLITFQDGILGFPDLYAEYYFSFRRCVIRRFPFSIFYTIESEEIIVHSVFDNRQDPEKRP